MLRTWKGEVECQMAMPLVTAFRVSNVMWMDEFQHVCLCGVANSSGKYFVSYVLLDHQSRIVLISKTCACLPYPPLPN